jgi:hypothetical protein
MHRTRIATAVLLAATTAGTVALAANASESNNPPCTPKITKIGGHTAAVNCGPATATLHIGGKTYTFRNGFCQQRNAAALQLDLGTTVVGVKGNAGKPNFSMLITHFHTGFGSGAVFGADYGGKSLLGGEGLINVRGNVSRTGTFTSTVSAGAKFTGSWNCHGFVWRHP